MRLACILVRRSVPGGLRLPDSLCGVEVISVRIVHESVIAVTGELAVRWHACPTPGIDECCWSGHRHDGSLLEALGWKRQQPCPNKE